VSIPALKLALNAKNKNQMLFIQKIRRNLVLFFTAFSIIIADQITKYFIRSSGGFYICNKGMAFGLTVPLLFFYFLWASIIFLLLFKLIAIKNIFQKYAIIFILAGAFSNLLDRLYFGCVIDFINLKIWPVFNLADISICLGAFFLIIKYKHLSK
jgi:signal peptidase II